MSHNNEHPLFAPDIPISHMGDFIGGSTHVLKVAERLAKKEYSF